MPASASEADIIQNRINVALAKSQRLVASWLPPPASTANTKSAQEIQEEEDAQFTPIPPRLGLGAPVPKEFADGDAKKQKELILNDKIRRKMMGGRSPSLLARPQSQPRKGLSSETASAGTARPTVGRALAEIDSEDESRSSQWKAKRPKDASANEGASGGHSSGAMAPSPGRSSASKRRTNYLDEFLLEKSEKKRKRNK
ncbi:MAG: hypothetical protein M1839_007627 [Geoglossum umbratile]|nr:MAG: hypothetical protein M1839_007627 [Geoglossum umbratile]